MKASRSRFYNEMRLARILQDVDLLDPACQWQKPSIICNQRQLKARVLWRELMSRVTSLERGSL